MSLIQPTPVESKILLRALLTVVQSRTALSLIQAAQRLWLNTDYNLETLDPISPATLAARLTHSELRVYLIQAMVVLVILDDQPDWQIYKQVQHYCQALQISESYLRPLWLWCAQLHSLLALEVYSRCFVIEKYGYEWQQRGWGWLLQGALQYLGLWPDPELARRYHQLQYLPQTTLGYCYWAFCTQRHYAFPGEPGGLHEGLSFHDMTHVLAHYDTSALGELQAFALTAGYKQSGDPVASLLFILLQQHLGIQVGFLSQAQRGALNQPQAPELLIQALLMGATMTVDLSENWDPWPVMDQSIEALRSTYNLKLN